VWLEKVLRLQEVLVAIQNDRHLQGKLALKGGTALNLGYLGLARLSIDLDFNYIGSAGREEMLAERPELERWVERIGASIGYSVHRTGEDYASTILVFGYNTVFGGSDVLRVEINYLHRIPLFGVTEITSCPIGDEPVISFVSVGPAELIGGKIKALVERGAPRDVYDVHRYRTTPIEGLDGSELRTSFLVFAATIPADVRIMTPERVLVAVDDKRIQAELLPALRHAETADRAAMVDSVLPVLQEFLTWSEPEQAFLSAVASGRIEPEHLTDDSAVQARIQSHPALRWKVDNVAAHLRCERPPEGRRRGRPRQNR